MKAFIWLTVLLVSVISVCGGLFTPKAPPCLVINNNTNLTLKYIITEQGGYFKGPVIIDGNITVDGINIFNGSINFINVTIINYNVTGMLFVNGNISAAFFCGDGSCYNIQQLYLDTNASTACTDGEYLDGNGLCIDLNGTGDIRWVNVAGDTMTGDLRIKDSDGEYHNISRDLQIADEISRNITLTGLNGTLDLETGNLTITTLSGDNIVVNIDKTETILDRNSDSIIITSGTNESPVLTQVVYSNAGVPVLTKRTALSLKSPSVAAFLQGANYTYVSAVGLATTDNLIGGIFNRFFRDGSTYRSGFEINVSTNMINISTGVISFLFSEIPIIQNHSTSELHAHVHEDGSFHQHFTIDDDNTYNEGSAISNNKYFNAVFGIAITHDGAGVMYTVTQDKPSTEYTKAIDAEVDLEDTINFFPSNEIVSLAYIPVVRVVIRRSGGVNTIQTLSNGALFDDLRGTVTKTSASPPPSGITAHSDLTNLAWSVAGHTIDTDIDASGYDIDNYRSNASLGTITPNITSSDGILEIPSNISTNFGARFGDGTYYSELGAVDVSGFNIPAFICKSVLGTICYMPNGLYLVPSSANTNPVLFWANNINPTSNWFARYFVSTGNLVFGKSGTPPAGDVIFGDATNKVNVNVTGNETITGRLIVKKGSATPIYPSDIAITSDIDNPTSSSFGQTIKYANDGVSSVFTGGFAVFDLSNVDNAQFHYGMFGGVQPTLNIDDYVVRALYGLQFSAYNKGNVTGTVGFGDIYRVTGFDVEAYLGYDGAYITPDFFTELTAYGGKIVAKTDGTFNSNNTYFDNSLYGLYVETQDNFDSFNGYLDSYTLYLKSMQPRNNGWAIYSEGDVPSYFEGNVGIGTPTPTSKLHVIGDINGTGNVYLNGSTLNVVNGKVGIGTIATSIYELDVAGDIRASGDNRAIGTLSGGHMELPSSFSGTEAGGEIVWDDDGPTINIWSDNVGSKSHTFFPITTKEITSSSDAFDVTGISTLFINAGGDNVVIGGFDNGIEGQVLQAYLTEWTYNLTIEHNEASGTQKILMHQESDQTLLSKPGGWTFGFDGTYWHEIDNAEHTHP